MWVQRINGQELIPGCQDGSESLQFQITIHTRGIFRKINFFVVHGLPTVNRAIPNDSNEKANQDIHINKSMNVTTSISSKTNSYRILRFPDLKPKKHETGSPLCDHDKGIHSYCKVFLIQVKLSF